MGTGVLLDERDGSRATRGGLETEDAGTGKEIEAIEAVECLPEPVEQGFAHTIRRRPEAG